MMTPSTSAEANPSIIGVMVTPSMPHKKVDNGKENQQAQQATLGGYVYPP